MNYISINIIHMQNIFQVTEDTHLDTLFKNNTQKLIIVMYGLTACDPCKSIKPTFIALSKKLQECLFVYIDVDRFKDPNLKYTDDIEHTPHFNYFFNKTVICSITGAHPQALTDTTTNLFNKITATRNKFIQKEAEL